MSALHAKIDALELIAQSMTDDERRRAVEEITESYYSEHGDYPDPRSLERLANVMLGKALKSRNKRGPAVVYTDEQLASKDDRFGHRISLEAMESLTYDDTVQAQEHATGAEVERNVDSVEARIRRAIRANPDASNREIARIVGVSHTIVNRYRGEYR